MISATADTNIYISGLEFGGLPARFLELARDRAFRLDISESIKQEVLRVLREKFEYPPQRLLAVEAQIDRITNHVSPTQHVTVIKTDSSDNRILECAAAARVISLSAAIHVMCCLLAVMKEFRLSSSPISWSG